MDQTVNLLAYAFGGSNPPLPTSSQRIANNEQFILVTVSFSLLTEKRE